MDNLHQRLFGTFGPVLSLALDYPDEMADEEVQTNLSQLREIHEAVLDLEVRKTPFKGRTERSGQIEAWKQVVRKRLRKLKKAANTHLRGILLDAEGKRVNLKMPPNKASLKTVFDAVEDFEQKLRPHLSALVEKGVRPTVLDDLIEAAKKLEYYMTKAPDGTKVHKKLNDEMYALIGDGRRHVELMRADLTEAFEKNPLFKVAFDTAAKIKDKPGPPRERLGTVTSMKKQERKHRKKKGDRPRQPPEM